MRERAVKLAAGALLGGGLLLGVAPTPLADEGCAPAFDLSEPEGGTALGLAGSSVDVALVCAQLRGDRQIAASLLLIGGTALVLLTVPEPRSRAVRDPDRLEEARA